MAQNTSEIQLKNILIRSLFIECSLLQVNNVDKNILLVQVLGKKKIVNIIKMTLKCKDTCTKKQHCSDNIIRSHNSSG